MAFIFGTTQDDFLSADQFDSTLYGGIFKSMLLFTGNDRLWGGVANDKLSGGDGDDALFGSAGNNTLDRRTVSFKAPPNFELPTDMGANNVYNLTVTASDVSLSTAQAVGIIVAHVDEAPEITSGVSASFAGNVVNPTFCQPAPP